MKELDPYAVSDALTELNASLLKAEIDGLYLNAQQVRQMQSYILSIRHYAQAVSKELIDLRAALKEQAYADNQRLLTAFETCGNIIKFGPILNNKRKPNNGGNAA